MRSHFAPVYQVFGDSVLVDAHCGEGVERSRVHFSTTVRDDADYYFGPAIFTPGSGFAAGAEMSYVAHDAVHRPGEINLVFVVHRYTDEQLCFSCRSSDILTEFVPFEDKVVGVTGYGRVTHVSKFDFISAW